MNVDAPPAWALGFDVAFLKDAAKIFRDEFAEHTYGAFGIPKERDIAQARADGGLIWTKGDEKMAAVAIFRRAGQASTHKDFADREASFRPGDLFVRSIAGAPWAKRLILTTLLEKIDRGPMWVEAHVENGETVKLLDALGFRRIMTKISASSDLKGLFLRADPEQAARRGPASLDPADVPGIKVLAPDFLSKKDLSEIETELEAAGADTFAQHYSSYNKRRSWTSFALCGYDADDPKFIIKPAEMSKDWKAKNGQRLLAACLPTILAKRFPHTMGVLDRIPGRKQRVRFMRLSAETGELTRHSDITDPEAGVRDNQIARLHIPISTDPRCLFRSWTMEGREVQMHFPARALCYIDTRKPHAVINPSSVERIHLVVDTYCGPELRRMISQEE